MVSDYSSDTNRIAWHNALTLAKLNSIIELLEVLGNELTDEVSMSGPGQNVRKAAEEIGNYFDSNRCYLSVKEVTIDSQKQKVNTFGTFQLISCNPRFLPFQLGDCDSGLSDLLQPPNKAPPFYILLADETTIYSTFGGKDNFIATNSCLLNHYKELNIAYQNVR